MQSDDGAQTPPEGGDEERFRSTDFRDRLRSRDEAAWTELYRAYAHRLVGVAGRILPRGQDREGAAHDAWVLGYRKARSFGRGRKAVDPRAWLCTICINRCLSLRRRVRRQRNFAEGEAAALEARESSTAAARRDAAQERIRQAVAKLPRKDQFLTWLRYTAGASIPDIATLLGIKRNAVSVRLNRVRERLADVLEELESAEAPDPRRPDRVEGRLV